MSTYLVEAPVERVPRVEVRVAADVMVLLVDDQRDVGAALSQRWLRSQALHMSGRSNVLVMNSSLSR